MSLREALEHGAKLILEQKPLPLCGSKDRPHLHHPRVQGWTHCASCGHSIFVKTNKRK